MGSALALREGTPIITATPNEPQELARELRELTKELKVKQRLKGWARALRQLPRRNVTKFQWLLLVLNVSNNTIKVTGFSDRSKAAHVINEIEKTKKNSDLDAVLVWVRSVHDLKTLYPNYYADTGEFIHALNQVLR